MAQCYTITGRYDRPYTQLFLTSKDKPNAREWWWGANQLNALRLVDGQYYVTSTTPQGERLVVKPYEGDFGILKMGPGDRSLERLSIQGSLSSPKSALALGNPSNSSSGAFIPVSQCRLPVGDYSAQLCNH